MSLDGKFTPIGVNVYGELLQNNVFSVSTAATEYHGSWTTSECTHGTLVNTTFLKNLTDSLPNFYTMAKNQVISVDLYRHLLSIGRPINITTDDRINCPALGNSRPDTFKTSYAGWGTWDYKTVDNYGNVLSDSTTLKLVADTYPPKNYAYDGEYSYIYNLWGSIQQEDYKYDFQWNHPYAWVTGWPGKNEFQKDSDSYNAAYFPRPDIRDRDKGLVEYDEYFKHGFISTIARQAYYELWSDHTTRRPKQYTELVKSFQQCYNWKFNKNLTIGSLINSKTFINGNFSNINDLTTSDISGISLAFKDFGADLIKLGKALDLYSVNTFGLPSKLLLNLQKNSALTDALKFVLLYNELSTQDLDYILTSEYVPTVEQEKLIYESMTYIKGQDLENIKVILNCTTESLESLADLINPLKMFPNSYKTLTVPTFDISNPVSKIYDFIYTIDGVNPRIKNWGDYLTEILPNDLAIACGAFMLSINQIKNIRNMNIEQFGQVVYNLEVTDKDLPLVSNPTTTVVIGGWDKTKWDEYGWEYFEIKTITNNGANPVHNELVNNVLKGISHGSGNSGLYKQCDFFGAASGYPYVKYYEKLINILGNSIFSKLNIVYLKLYQKSINNDWALISRGAGYNDSIINTDTTWAPDYAYKLFVVQQTVEQTDLVDINGDLTNVLVPDTKISFDDGITQYTVAQSTYNGTNTTVRLTTDLTSKIEKNSPVYIYEDEYEISVKNLVDAANLEILYITNFNPELKNQINFYWDNIGTHLSREQQSIVFAVSQPTELSDETHNSEFESFLRSIEQYAAETEYGETAPVLEAICDLTKFGGQSLVAMMREARNAIRIANIGGELDNSISYELQLSNASAEACSLDSNGGIANIAVTSGGYGYSTANPPEVRIGPFGGVFGGSGSGAKAVATVVDGTVTKINIISPGAEYSLQNGCIKVDIDPPPTPTRLGETTVPGSFAGSAYINNFPVSDNLVTSPESSYSINDAVNKVTDCNCDCWPK